MRQRLRAAAFALMAGAVLTSAQAAEHPRHYLHRFAVHGVFIPGVTYTPISPLDYSLPNSERWAQFWQAGPCCPAYPAIYLPYYRYPY